MADDRLSDAWMRLMSILVQRRDALFVLLRRHGLNPPHGHTIQLLADGPMRMRDIAESLACDASYVTALVDHLEAANLVERRASTSDRRVKEIGLTAKGLRLSHQLEEVFAGVPPELQRMTRVHRDQFVEMMERLVPDLPTGVHPLRPPRV